MNIKWHEVTWYSRWGAIILFLVVVPILAFCIGAQYKETELVLNSQGDIQSQTSPPKKVHSDINLINLAVENNNSDWKTYSNESYEFEFTYPASWVIASGGIPLSIVSISEHPEWGGASGGVGVSAIKKQTFSEAFVNAQKEAGKVSNTTYSNPESVTVANVAAIKRDYQPSEIAPSGTEYIFPEQGLVLTLTDLYTNNQTVRVDDSEIQRAILVSFKFTK